MPYLLARGQQVLFVSLWRLMICRFPSLCQSAMTVDVWQPQQGHFGPYLGCLHFGSVGFHRIFVEWHVVAHRWQSRLPGRFGMFQAGESLGYVGAYA